MRIRRAAAWVLGIVLASGAAPALADPMSMAYEIADVETGITESFDGGGYFDGLNTHSYGMYAGSPIPFAPGDHYYDVFTIAQVNESYWSVKNAGNEEYNVLDMNVDKVQLGGFNFGGAGSDRALGILAGDRSVVIRLLKANFKNKTGDAQPRLHVEFDAEPWAKYDGAEDAGFKVLLSFGGGEENNAWLEELTVHWTEEEVATWDADALGNVDGNALAVHYSATFDLGAVFERSIAIANDQEFEIQFSYTGIGQKTGVGVDNLHVSFVPEPGTVALMALGLAGLALRHRK